MVSRNYTCVILGGALLALNCRSMDRREAQEEGARQDKNFAEPYPSNNTEPVSAAVSGIRGASANATAGGGAIAPPTVMLDDPQIAAVTEAVNTAEIQQAQLARSKSKNETVLRFAAMMIEHHGEAKRKQKLMKLSPVQSELSKKLDEDAKSTLEQLRKSTSADFDAQYLKAQAAAHELVLDTLKRDLLPQAKDPKLVAYLEEINPQIELHLEQARAGVQALRSQPPTANASASGAPGALPAAGHTGH